MESAKALGKTVGVDHVFTRLNYRVFPEYFELMLCRLGVNYFNMIYPHYRGVMAKHADRLAVSYGELAPFVRRAMALFTDRGLPAFSRVLVNFPPCVLPGYQHIVADWERDDVPSGETLAGPGLALQRLDAMKAGQKSKPARCRDCALGARCGGVDREYLERFGDREFVPLARRPRPAPIRTIYA
ncbi:MAG: hypothetical protein PHF00_09040, partial [Elusimicrobia bacterium]|nr:hypothetical protein [Elusimicrobiota bacterium]